MPGYTTFTVEPSPYQMSLAASDFNSSPESVVSNRSGPMEYADYRGGLPPLFINTQPRQETNRETLTDKTYCNLYKPDKQDTGRLSSVLFSTQPRQVTNKETLTDKTYCNLYKPDKPDTGSLSPVFISTKPRQETYRDIATDKMYCNLNKSDKPDTGGLSASVMEDRYNPVPNVNQSDYHIRPHSGQFQGVPVGETLEKEWRPSLPKSSSSKPWVAQLDVDLRRCIEERVSIGRERSVRKMRKKEKNLSSRSIYPGFKLQRERLVWMKKCKGQ